MQARVGPRAQASSVPGVFLSGNAGLAIRIAHHGAHRAGSKAPMNASSLLPIIEPNDSSDTRWALETARTLWDQGERREALQWVLEERPRPLRSPVRTIVR